MSKVEKEQEVKLIREDLDRVSSISALSNMKGGKMLIDKMIKEILGSVDTLCLKYRSLTLQEFVGICADMNVKFDLLKTFKTASKSKKIAQEDLKKALEELELED